MDRESKFFLASKTYQGLIVMVLSIVLQNVLGVDSTEASAQASDLVQKLLDLTFLLGTLWATYGRHKATKAVTLMPKAKVAAPPNGQ